MTIIPSKISTTIKLFILLIAACDTTPSLAALLNRDEQIQALYLYQNLTKYIDPDNQRYLTIEDTLETFQKADQAVMQLLVKQDKNNQDFLASCEFINESIRSSESAGEFNVALKHGSSTQSLMQENSPAVLLQNYAAELTVIRQVLMGLNNSNHKDELDLPSQIALLNSSNYYKANILIKLVKTYIQYRPGFEPETLQALLPNNIPATDIPLDALTQDINALIQKGHYLDIRTLLTQVAVTPQDTLQQVQQVFRDHKAADAVVYFSTFTPPDNLNYFAHRMQVLAHIDDSINKLIETLTLTASLPLNDSHIKTPLNKHKKAFILETPAVIHTLNMKSRHHVSDALINRIKRLKSIKEYIANEYPIDLTERLLTLLKLDTQYLPTLKNEWLNSVKDAHALEVLAALYRHRAAGKYYTEITINQIVKAQQAQDTALKQLHQTSLQTLLGLEITATALPIQAILKAMITLPLKQFEQLDAKYQWLLEQYALTQQSEISADDIADFLHAALSKDAKKAQAVAYDFNFGALQAYLAQLDTHNFAMRLPTLLFYPQSRT